MAPTPTEDVDLSVLRDKILEVFRVLWTLVSNLCLALWSCVSQGFWTVWTYPPFEAFRNEFAAALVALMDYAVAHPATTIAIVILAFILVPTVLNTLINTFLYCVGFRKSGVLRGSYAANYQSTSYGGNVPRGSAFSWYQSQGARR